MEIDVTMESTAISRLAPRKTPVYILDKAIPMRAYTSIDFAVTNKELEGLDIQDPEICQQFVNGVLEREGALAAFGGYLEKRNLYTGFTGFSSPGQPGRDIHLGIDFWARAGTTVLSPMDGKVHSFRNNESKGDYGPTIILEHGKGYSRFYSLYGHLADSSLEGLRNGRLFPKGSVLGRLGSPEINGNYAPHLHFQLILDMGNYHGDYPGVCGEHDLAYYRNNCPDPGLLLHIATYGSG